MIRAKQKVSSKIVEGWDFVYEDKRKCKTCAGSSADAALHHAFPDFAAVYTKIARPRFPSGTFRMRMRTYEMRASSRKA